VCRFYSLVQSLTDKYSSSIQLEFLNVAFERRVPSILVLLQSCYCYLCYYSVIRI
jgi:hypothetical protein